MEYDGVLLQEDWVEYPYWEFTKWMVRGNHTEASLDLQSAILYSAAFMDDNDDIHIVTDTKMAEKVIQNEQEVLLSYLVRTDDIKREKVEVLVIDDL